ncbi:MaoC/PaaZ C-terminal domain-containing protein [Streptomyces sp. NPDC050161]|uniref:MaoC/PaaZ C-terminal domain-containing protein n=1 Tax=Streptomyces sp. NPDC050161 TaxID=3365604 RepID=UPI0037ADA4E7
MRYHYEDFPAGRTHDLGRERLTADDITGYARRYDPMPFHLSEETARHSPFGGLVASGWHTGAVVMGRFVRTLLADSACQGSYGMDEVRFMQPVRPGDELAARAEVEAAEPHHKRPGIGVVSFLVTAANQDGAQVYRMRTRLLFARRTAATATGSAHAEQGAT